MSDRPLRRKLIRLAFRLAPGRTHAEAAWPNLSIARSRDGRAGEAQWRDRPLCALLPLAALPPAETVSVVGSGPSMAQIDPRRLPGLPILLNGAVSLAPRLGREIVLAVEDERFVWRRFELMRKAVPDDATCLFSVSVLRALAERGAGWLAGRRVILLDNLLKPYGARRQDLTASEVAPRVFRHGDAAVSRDPETGVVIAGTVALSAVQVALGLGVKRVALAGVDLSDTDAPRFYETSGDRAPSGIESGQARILSHFAAANALALSRGQRLETVTPGSALETIGIPYRPL